MTDIAVAILSALAGFLVWIVQRYYERKAAERLRREELYGTLLSSSAEFIGTGNMAPFIFESQRAWLYASDEVLERINDYLTAALAEGESERSGVDSSTQQDDLYRAEGHLRLSIRRDLHPATQLTKAWVDKHWNRATSTPARIQEYLQRDRSKSGYTGDKA